LALVSFFSPPKYIYTTEKQKEIHEELSDVGETTFQLGQQQAGDLRPQESAVSKRYAPMDQGLALIISESIDAPVVLWGPQIWSLSLSQPSRKGFYTATMVVKHTARER
jgi:hypothetical protein